MPARITILSVLVCLVVYPASAIAEQEKYDYSKELFNGPLPMTGDEKIDQAAKKLNESLKEVEKWAALQKKISRQRKNDCLEAFGHSKFCNCLDTNLHWVINFDSYIRIMTSPTLKTSTIRSDDERTAVESVFKSRERCVEKYIQKKTQ